MVPTVAREVLAAADSSHCSHPPLKSLDVTLSMSWSASSCVILWLAWLCKYKYPERKCNFFTYKFPCEFYSRTRECITRVSRNTCWLWELVGTGTPFPPGSGGDENRFDGITTWLVAATAGEDSAVMYSCWEGDTEGPWGADAHMPQFPCAGNQRKLGQRAPLFEHLKNPLISRARARVLTGHFLGKMRLGLALVAASIISLTACGIRDNHAGTRFMHLSDAYPHDRLGIPKKKHQGSVARVLSSLENHAGRCLPHPGPLYLRGGSESYVLPAAGPPAEDGQLRSCTMCGALETQATLGHCKITNLHFCASTDCRKKHWLANKCVICPAFHRHTLLLVCFFWKHMLKDDKWQEHSKSMANDITAMTTLLLHNGKNSPMLPCRKSIHGSCIDLFFTLRTRRVFGLARFNMYVYSYVFADVGGHF